jgi:D-alanyl-D-alanine carboxypeptidase
MFGTCRGLLFCFWGLFGLLTALLVAGCAQNAGGGYASSGGNAGQGYAPTQYYPPPGTAEDPWGPYIREAAARYDIPEQWIRAVMQQESGGEEQAVSPVGAIGLMQVMPDTYEDLQASNGLGDDPFNPRDNIMAGAAYIREMYNLYGSPGFLAAYNAGPGDVDDYLAGTAALPDETVNYLAAVAPNLGNAVPPSGVMAQYAATGVGIAPNVTGFATGCDVNAAYDPDHPCAIAPPSEAAQAQVAAGACDPDMAYDPGHPCAAAPSPAAANVQVAAGACDPDLAYDPDQPCAPAPTQTPAPAAAPAPQPVAAVANAQETGSALYQPAVVVTQPLAASSPPASAAPQGAWAVQVGAFDNPALARAMAESARAEAPDQLAAAVIAVPATTPFGGLVLYRARLVDLSAGAAARACASLNRRQLPCIVVPAVGG